MTEAFPRYYLVAKPLHNHNQHLDIHYESLENDSYKFIEVA